MIKLNNFIILIEGQDRTGKDTLIKYLTQQLFEYSPIVIHCIGPSKKCKEPLKQSKEFYKNLLLLISNNNNNFILNRSHLGEIVYGPLYRNYDGYYVLDLEKKYLLNTDKNVILISLIDSSYKNIKREDGDSLSNNTEDINNEIKQFKNMYELSNIKNKLFIDINNKIIEDVRYEVINFLKEIN